MEIRHVRESVLSVAERESGAMIVGCGYERRSQGITSVMRQIPPSRIALCYREFSNALSRKENEAFFSERDFSLENVGANSPDEVRAIVRRATTKCLEQGSAIIFDISTMTRAWHGAIIRELRIQESHAGLRTFFTYVPSKYQPPKRQIAPNEIVGPVEGFTSLVTPDLPVAAIIGLGYEREGALGLQQLIDPQLTVLMVPNSGKKTDTFYQQVLKNNKEVLQRTDQRWVFEYDLSEPASTFASMVSIISGLVGQYRIILASLGPKIFGLLCFLLATKYPDLSVWRASSGVHGEPRDSLPDLDRIVVLDVTWTSSRI